MNVQIKITIKDLCDLHPDRRQDTSRQICTTTWGGAKCYEGTDLARKAT